MTGIHQRTAPTKINRTDWNDLVTFLGGTSDDPQVDATKILLAQGGSLLSTWRYASDLTKIDAAKVASDLAAAQMQTNILAAIIAAGGIVDADVAAAAAIAKSKISTNGTWVLTDLPSVPQCRAFATVDQTLTTSVLTAINLTDENYDTDTIHNNITNNTRFTCKTAGLYTIAGEAVFAAASATGQRSLLIGVNASVFIAENTIPVNSASLETFLNLSTQYRLAVNDYVELYGYQTSGGNLNVRAATGRSPVLAMAWLSP